MFILVAANGLVPFFVHFLGDGQVGDRAAFLLFGVEPGVEEGEEDELGPAEVVDVGRGQFAVPVVAEAQHLELAAEVGDVLFGGDAGMGAGLFGVLFGGESKGIPTHGVHDACSPHPLVSADDIGGRVAFGVPDVESVAARVGKHVEHVDLAVAREPGSGKGIVLGPEGLPFGFDDCRVIARHVQLHDGYGIPTGARESQRDLRSQVQLSLAFPGGIGPLGTGLSGTGRGGATGASTRRNFTSTRQARRHATCL